MLNEIFPKRFFVGYTDCAPSPDDTAFLFDGETLCCRIEGDVAVLPKFSEFPEIDNRKYHYLFSIDDERFFLLDTRFPNSAVSPDGYEWQEYGIFRTAGPRHLAFATITAWQLYRWYKESAHCSCCGSETNHSETERACVCKKCGHIKYPTISPCVIVAVTNGEHLLVTRYRGGPHRRYALVAGFSEIGEALEDTVRREVFEETGVRVKNIKYYKSQPWGFTSTLLAGFFCELDGSPEITLDEDELSEAIWLTREDIPPADNSIAMTAEMMEVFRLGRI
ncbi:MAG: NAD(+) diphosphatase [Oscillospiraceae bacterium]|nr:NAD(+) diphosphatase [Oscillospiraceae bacterium]